MTKEQLKELALHAAKGTAPVDYTYEDVNVAFAAELKELAGSINRFNQNKYTIFEILIEAVDEIVPRKVIDVMGMFAEIKQVGQGQKALFKVAKGRQRARKFLTQVGLSGVYESFRLDQTTYEVAVKAIGGAVSIDFERMLDGTDSLADMMDIVAEGLEDAVYIEVQRALSAKMGAGTSSTNYISNAFDAAKFARLIMTVKAYGEGAVVFAPPEFILGMGPDEIVAPTTSGVGIYHPDDIDAIHKSGRIKIFRGTPIVEIPQSFVDEGNKRVWIDPSRAYIFPTGKERIVKVVFEGDTQMWDFVNPDQSIEIHVYKKFGVGIETDHNWATYVNSGIASVIANDTPTLYNPYPNL